MKPGELIAFILNRRVRDTSEPPVPNSSHNPEHVDVRSVENTNPNAEQINHQLVGDKHRDQKQWREAAEAYTRHLELYPEDDAIWVQCGNCFKEAGDFARSLTAYKRAEQLNAINFDVHLQLGHFNKITGRLSEALKCYEQAALLNPDFGEAKHEIQDTLNRINSSSGRGFGATNEIFSSVDQLIAFLQLQSEEDDIIVSYFRSVSGR
jgi:tetratricopeptide (TPR) repeat protein